MKTIEEFLQENNFTTRYDACGGEEVISIDEFKKSMQQYAKQCCDEQIEACVNNIKHGEKYTQRVHEVITTPNVVKP